MQRIDLFKSIHKGLRRSLFDTARAVAATDFENDLERARAVAAIELLFGFLDEHAAHEDDVVLPELAQVAPELFIDLRSEHARAEGLQREIEAVVARLERASERERASLGNRLDDRVAKLVAHLLLHMAREESEANRILWAHLSDDQLLALQARIVASVDPARLAQWYALALPAMNARERAGLLQGLRTTHEPAQFEALTTAARRELGELQWHAALATARI